jgi:hypothetical protein
LPALSIVPGACPVATTSLVVAAGRPDSLQAASITVAATATLNARLFTNPRSNVIGMDPCGRPLIPADPIGSSAK